MKIKEGLGNSNQIDKKNHCFWIFDIYAHVTINSLITFLNVILTPILEKVSDENVGRRQVAGALVVAPTAL